MLRLTTVTGPLSSASIMRVPVLSSAILGNPPVPPFFVYALLLTLTAATADQLVAPVLFSTAPLFAVLACLLLSIRHGYPLGLLPFNGSPLSSGRVLLFLSLHFALVTLVRLPGEPVLRASGSLSGAGWAFLSVKVLVLAPAFVLLPWRNWRSLASCYAAEFAAGGIVFLTFFPRRIVEGLWPWYGQFLGRFVELFSWPFVSGLGYVKALYPTLTGPLLDVTILLSCSGVNGIELFDVLFALVVFCDWPRLNKGRALVAYFVGVAAMILGNVVRIASFVVLGNHGFADFVARFHVNAGWFFFAAMFLIFLSCTYRWMLSPSRLAPPTAA
jgi:exosortase/archaeosortase family protein